ncbi:MAG TPA: cupin domain-containing protein [Opitutaceae bacterium]
MKTPYAKFIKIVPFVIGVLGVSFAHAEQVTATSGDVKWVNAPASLPQGTKLAIMEGDLSKPGALKFRLKFPADYKLEPQSSPAIDRIMVVSGNFNLGSGKKFDKSRTIPMYTGYMHWPHKSPFFAWTSEETIVEYEGVGPWAVTYVYTTDLTKKE